VTVNVSMYWPGARAPGTTLTVRLWLLPLPPVATWTHEAAPTIATAASVPTPELLVTATVCADGAEPSAEENVSAAGLTATSGAAAGGGGSTPGQKSWGAHGLIVPTRTYSLVVMS
jgi:hypothetical protein